MGKKGKRIGLALGAGGARGLAHIGVLRVLEKEEIPIDLIVGTSIGALVGGAYASGMTPDNLEQKVDEYLNSSEFQSSAIKAFESAHEKGDVGFTQKIQSYLKNRYYVVQAMFKPGILSNEDLERLLQLNIKEFWTTTLQMGFPAGGSGEKLEEALDQLCQAAESSVINGCALIILSDRKLPEDLVPIPALLVGAWTARFFGRPLRRRTECLRELLRCQSIGRKWPVGKLGIGGPVRQRSH